MHTDLGTVGRAIWELRRKVTFRSRTEPCRFMWMRVTESPCFLWVEHVLSAHRCTMMGKLKLMGSDPLAATLLGWLMPCGPVL